MHDEQGFTLIEPMVTLAMAAILLIAGVPSLQEFIKSNRMTTRVNSFVSGLHFARSEAAKLGSRVTLCKSADLGNCTTRSGWEQGWIPFTDQGTAGAIDGNEAIISAYHPEPSDVSIRGNTLVKNRTSYLSSGIVEPSNGSVIV